MLAKKIRVLVVDDSALVRRVLSEVISAEMDMELVATAPDANIAREKIERLKPDVVTLDIEMPGMDGLTFLRQLMKERPLPVIIISSVSAAGSRAALEAMQAGAIEVLCKPNGSFSLGDLRAFLPLKIRAAARAKTRPVTPNLAPGSAPKMVAAQPRTISSDTIIAIGASTGGPEALRQLLVEIPANTPPILIVQHIPPVFSKAFAERLDQCCRISVKEAENGDEVRAGRALIAPGNRHLSLVKSGNTFRAVVRDGPLVCYQRPSADVLFASVAETAGRSSIGVILTGMGNDGAQGLLKMKTAGAHTIAQDEESCVIFGMPKEAIRAGAVDQVMPLRLIAQSLASRMPTAVGSTRR